MASMRLRKPYFMHEFIFFSNLPDFVQAWLSLQHLQNVEVATSTYGKAIDDQRNIKVGLKRYDGKLPLLAATTTYFSH